MINYIIVDTANMFFRAKHVVRGDSLDTKIGMCWHIMFSSINKALHCLQVGKISTANKIQIKVQITDAHNFFINIKIINNNVPPNNI